MPVMAELCPTCPFLDDGDLRMRARIQNQVLTDASQTCHHSGGLANRDTHLCRGARDFQLQIFHRMGFLAEPTYECFRETSELLARRYETRKK